MSNVITATWEILEYPADPLLAIERASRNCYQSEGKIEPGSAERLVRKLMASRHHAMIEFGGWIVVAFTSNRGFTHEMVRMRLCSFAQESTRWCNYAKDRFGKSITVVDPDSSLRMKIKDPERRRGYARKMFESWLRAEADYLELVDSGCPAEIAREVLPIGLKARIIVGANVREWIHIGHERTSAKAHPRMREVMIPLFREFQRRTPVLWDDIVEKTNDLP